MGGFGRLVERDERLPWARGTDGAICDGDGDVLGAAAGGSAVGNGDAAPGAAIAAEDVVTPGPVVVGGSGGGTGAAGVAPAAAVPDARIGSAGARARVRR
jgi:hypothetical protein